MWFTSSLVSHQCGSHQVLLGVDSYDTDAIAINKLRKLNFSYFTMYLATMSAAGYQGGLF